MKKIAIEYQKYFSFLLSKPNYFFQFAMGYPVQDHIMEVHEEMKHFTCLICLFVSSNERGLKKHQQNKHENENILDQTLMKPEKKERKSKPKKCYVKFCTSREGDSNIRLYSCLRADKIQSDAWTKAIEYKNKDGSFKTPYRSTRICSRHFVSGVPSKISDSIDYIPTIFPKKGEEPKRGRPKKIKNEKKIQKKTSETNILECSFCNDIFIKGVWLEAHVRRAHNIDCKEMKKCEVCSENFKTFLILNQHLLSDHKIFECIFCTETFSEGTVLEIEEHLKESHDIDPMKEVKCETCSSVFDRFLKYNQHMLSVHAIKKCYKCEICDYISTNPFLLNNHYKYVHKKEPELFNCDKCDKKYTKQWMLEDHVKSFHDKIKDEQCQKCGKTFSLKSQLNQHIRKVHENINVKNHVCDICGKSFKRRALLRDHILSHEGVKPHKCDLCDLKFLRKNQLNKHVKIVHDKIRNFECETCGKTFGNSCGLKTHINIIHEDKRDFICNICNKAFHTRGNLKNHKTNVHKSVDSNIIS